MKILTLSSCALLLAASLSAAWADTLTLNPTADTYTRTGRSSVGSDTFLNIDGFGGNDFMAYIRFDLSSLPAGATIDSATFTVYYSTAASRQDGITTGRFANFGLFNVAGNTPQNWDEATLAGGAALNVGQEYGAGDYAALTTAVNNSWLANLDAENGANVTETIGGSVDGDPESVSGPDLVSFLDNRVADGGLTTFISAVDASGRGYGYSSRENASSSLWPSLSITYTPVPEPSLLALLGLGVVGFFARRRKA